MLQISKENILEWSEKYDDRHKGSKDQRTEVRLKQVLEKQRYLEGPDFVELCLWKSQRQKKR
jgi:hypothetical protein